jgi:hypothetical protein
MRYSWMPSPHKSCPLLEVHVGPPYDNIATAIHTVHSTANFAAECFTRSSQFNMMCCRKLHTSGQGIRSSLLCPTLPSPRGICLAVQLLQHNISTDHSTHLEEVPAVAVPGWHDPCQHVPLVDSQSPRVPLNLHGHKINRCGILFFVGCRKSCRLDSLPLA